MNTLNAILTGTVITLAGLAAITILIGFAREKAARRSGRR